MVSGSAKTANLHKLYSENQRVYFEPNEGQFDPSVRFVARGAAYEAWITNSEIVLVFSRTSGLDMTRIRFGPPRSPANRPEAEGLDRLDSYSSYFLGSDPKAWRTRVPNYARVKLKGVYRGVDMLFYAKGREIEYDFIVHPGGSLDHISLDFGTAGKPLAGLNGSVTLATRSGRLTHSAPLAIQAGRALFANARLKSGQLRFELGPFDRSQPLVIDPVLEYSSYLGGSGGQDVATDVAVDAAGNAHVVGRTDSSNFPVLNPLQAIAGDSSGDVFVVKLNTAGARVYSTYIGGSGLEYGEGIAIDLGGNVYVTGHTESTNYPSVNGVQPTLGGGTDVFLSKLSAAGSAIVYSTYLGGSSYEHGLSVAVDSLSSAYVTGTTFSGNFPRVNAFQNTMSGFGDAFLAKLSPSGSSLVYSTFLGGSSGNDEGSFVAVDGVGSAYITGRTDSTNFPVVNALQSSSAGGTEAFVTKFSAVGNSLVFSTYLGGSGTDQGAGLALNTAGELCVTGQTTSPNFPTVNPIQPSYGGTSDIYVAKFNSAGSALLFSTYFGGSASDFGSATAFDSAGSCYVTGTAQSILTSNAVQPANGGNADAFVLKLNSTGSTIGYSTYLGGSSYDFGTGIGVDALGNAYVVGGAGSSNFPVANPAQAASAGAFDGFVARISDQPPDATPPVVSVNAAPGANVNGWNSGPVTVTFSVTDPESAIVSQSGCGTITLSTETTAAGTTLSCVATSAGGTASQSITIKIDMTPPTGLASRTPAPNGSGWNNTNVSIGFSCVDGLSGVQVAGATQVISTEGAAQSRSFLCTDLAGNVLPLFVSGVNIDRTAPVVTAASVLAVPNPVQVNVPISITAGMTDLGSSNLALAQYRIDGGSFVTFGSVSGGTSTASGSIGPIASPSVVNLCVRAMDNAGNLSGEECTMLAVYDPSGGFVTGAGTFQSPPGALTGSTASGRAQFAFHSKYLPGANTPSGNTQFKFKAADFEFDSRSYEWLVVAGAKAKYRGQGVIKGLSGIFDFALTAIDGQLPGGGGQDKLRLKITGPGGVVYDNQVGSADEADPTTVIDGGSIVIHR